MSVVKVTSNNNLLHFGLELNFPEGTVLTRFNTRVIAI